MMRLSPPILLASEKPSYWTYLFQHGILEDQEYDTGHDARETEMQTTRWLDGEKKTRSFNYYYET